MVVSGRDWLCVPRGWLDLLNGIEIESPEEIRPPAAPPPSASGPQVGYAGGRPLAVRLEPIKQQEMARLGGCTIAAQRFGLDVSWHRAPMCFETSFPLVHFFLGDFFFLAYTIYLPSSKIENF